MQLAKGFILLAHHPSFFVVKADFNMVLSVGPMVDWIIGASGSFDLAIQAHLEKVCSAVIIFVF